MSITNTHVISWSGWGRWGVEEGVGGKLYLPVTACMLEKSLYCPKTTLQCEAGIWEQLWMFGTMQFHTCHLIKAPQA